MRCGEMVRCWDFQYRPCRLPKGHTYPGHNPFSSEMSQTAKVVSKENKPEQSQQIAVGA